MKPLNKNMLSALLNDPIGKIVTILIACFMWYYVNIFSMNKTIISLPITLINQPKDKTIRYDDDLAVRIEINSNEDISRRIEDLQAIVDLSNYTIGTNHYPITLLNLPRDLRVSLNPQQYRITVYDITNKIVPIIVKIPTHPLLTNSTVTPKNINIYGTPKVINQINAFNIDPFLYDIPIGNIFSTNIRITTPQGADRITHNTVTITLYFNQNTYTNEVFLPISTIGLHSNLILNTPTSPAVKIVTITSNIEPLLVESRIVLSLTNIMQEGRYNVPINIETPSNVLVLSSNISIPIEMTTKQSNIGSPNDPSEEEIPPLSQNPDTNKTQVPESEE